MACKRSAVRSRLAPPKQKVLKSTSPSSRGLGHYPFTVVTPVRIRLGTPLSTYFDLALEGYFFNTYNPATSLVSANDSGYQTLTKENNMSLTSQEIAAVLKKHQLNSKDTGSPEVQIAILTAKIRKLTEHFKAHKQDFHSRRGLLRQVSLRHKLLNYLRTEDLDRYQKLVKELDLRSQ